jgi:hypothetical protein
VSKYPGVSLERKKIGINFGNSFIPDLMMKLVRSGTEMSEGYISIA